MASVSGRADLPWQRGRLRNTGSSPVMEKPKGFPALGFQTELFG